MPGKVMKPPMDVLHRGRHGRWNCIEIGDVELQGMGATGCLRCEFPSAGLAAHRTHDAVSLRERRCGERGTKTDLATEAGVGFATPFNHFGSKNAIMRALSARVIERMAGHFRAESPPGDSIQRVLAMARIAVALLLTQATV